MIPEVNIISGKASVESVKGVGGSGGDSESLSRNFLEHLNQLKIDLNVVEIINIQDNKSTKH